LGIQSFENFNMAEIKFKIYPGKIFKGLVGIIAMLLVLNILGMYVYLTTENLRPFQSFFIGLFDFSYEGNIPAFFSSLLLLIASCLLFLVSFTEKLSQRKYLGWMGLGLVFAFLAIDEAVSIHEFFTGLFKRKFNLSGYLYYAWVVPYGIGVVILAFTLIPFFLKLDLRMFKMMMLSGLVFVIGAIGLEIIAGKAFEENSHDLLLMILYTIEELLEMLGVSIFIYSLFWFLSIGNKRFSFVVVPKLADQEDEIKSRTLQETLFP